MPQPSSRDQTPTTTARVIIKIKIIIKITRGNSVNYDEVNDDYESMFDAA